jgi:hypothetical protein
LNSNELKKSEPHIRLHHVPILVQAQESPETAPVRDQIWKGQATTGTVLSVKGAYVFVRLPNGKQGRIHKSLFPIEQDKSKHFGYSVKTLDLLQKGSELECTVISVKLREGAQSHFIELSTIGKPTIRMTGEVEKDEGKVLFGVIRAVTPLAPTVISLEMLGGHHVSLNGWESNIVDYHHGSSLNTLNELARVGDLVKVELQRDYQGRL